MIQSIYPNPVATYLTVNYDALGASSAHLLLVEQQGNQIITQFSINPNVSSAVLGLSEFPLGSYSLVLVCDGVIKNFINLIIQ